MRCAVKKLAVATSTLALIGGSLCCSRRPARHHTDDGEDPDGRCEDVLEHLSGILPGEVAALLDVAA